MKSTDPLHTWSAEALAKSHDARAQAHADEAEDLRAGHRGGEAVDHERAATRHSATALHLRQRDAFAAALRRIADMSDVEADFERAEQPCRIAREALIAAGLIWSPQP